ncbi:Alpha-1D adrenergic receptor [Chionoecetes opilio]|uniref:Alpha-1D adrenergic receptor n=1 Tax=Chionoecetes opilio TaxID=41210 RepID=A0A8J4YIE0_CHIOP|nr:Alpha-1D adrenergic receptor [Chionoecetes opilio]
MEVVTPHLASGSTTPASEVPLGASLLWAFLLTTTHNLTLLQHNAPPAEASLMPEATTPMPQDVEYSAILPQASAMSPAGTSTVLHHHPSLRASPAPTEAALGPPRARSAPAPPQHRGATSPSLVFQGEREQSGTRHGGSAAQLPLSVPSNTSQVEDVPPSFPSAVQSAGTNRPAELRGGSATFAPRLTQASLLNGVYSGGAVPSPTTQHDAAGTPESTASGQPHPRQAPPGTVEAFKTISIGPDDFKTHAHTTHGEQADSEGLEAVLGIPGESVATERLPGDDGRAPGKNWISLMARLTAGREGGTTQLSGNTMQFSGNGKLLPEPRTASQVRSQTSEEIEGLPEPLAGSSTTHEPFDDAIGSPESLGGSLAPQELSDGNEIPPESLTVSALAPTPSDAAKSSPAPSPKPLTASLVASEPSREAGGLLQLLPETHTTFSVVPIPSVKAEGSPGPSLEPLKGPPPPPSPQDDSAPTLLIPTVLTGGCVGDQQPPDEGCSPGPTRQASDPPSTTQDAFNVTYELLASHETNTTTSEAVGSRGGIEWSTFKVVMFVVQFVIMVETVIGNLMVILAVRMEKKLQTPFNYYIVNLAFTDMNVGLSVMSLFMFYNLYDYFPFNALLCHYWVWSDYTMTFESVMTLAAIRWRRRQDMVTGVAKLPDLGCGGQTLPCLLLPAACPAHTLPDRWRALDCRSVDRLWSVTWSLHYRTHNSGRKSAYIIAGTWCLVAVIWLPPFLYDRVVNAYPAGDCYWDTVLNKNLVVYVGFLGYYTPLLVMLGAYARILWVVRKRANTIRDAGRKPSIQPDPNSGLSSGGGGDQTRRAGAAPAKDGQQEMKLRREMKAVYTLLNIVVIFLLCWVPFYTLFVLSAWFPTLFPTWYVTSSYWMAYINSAVNPVLYPLTSLEFRQAYKKVVRTVLGPYPRRNLLLNFPITKRGQRSFSDVQWISVWCRRFAIDFGHVVIPHDLVKPAPQRVTGLSSDKPTLHSSAVTLKDTNTIELEDFTFDGTVTDAIFVIGGGDPTSSGIPVNNERGSSQPLTKYSGKTIKLEVPDEFKNNPIQYLGVWSPGKGMLASVTFDPKKPVPPALSTLDF